MTKAILAGNDNNKDNSKDLFELYLPDEFLF